jgi:hypothetical protein
MSGVRQSPPDIGSVDATSRRSREASFNGSGRVVRNGTSSKDRIRKRFGNPNHPVCAVAVASHLFLDGAAIPPLSVSGGEIVSLSLFDRAFDDRSRCFATLWENRSGMYLFIDFEIACLRNRQKSQLIPSHFRPETRFIHPGKAWPRLRSSSKYTALGIGLS